MLLHARDSLVVAVYGVLLLVKVMMMMGLLWYASIRAERLEETAMGIDNKVD
jgi:hypothetical protein